MVVVAVLQTAEADLAIARAGRRYRNIVMVVVDRLNW
jgi:hypothetical protein